MSFIGYSNQRGTITHYIVYSIVFKLENCFDIWQAKYNFIPGARFMLLHDANDNRNDDGIKNFFQDIYESYMKVSSRF